MRRRGALGTLAALPLLLLPMAQAAPPGGDLQNGQSNGFGAIAMPPYVAGPGPTAVEVRIHIADPAALPAGGRLLFGLSAPEGAARARIDGVATLDGRALAAEPGSAAGSAHEPRRAVAVADLAGASDLVLRGTAWAEESGRFLLGALAMAFDAAWMPAAAPDGPAQLYAFSWLGAKRLERGGPPFAGQGNALSALAPVAVLAAFCGGLWLLSRGPPRAFGRPLRPPRPDPVARPPPRPPAAFSALAAPAALPRAPPRPPPARRPAPAPRPPWRPPRPPRPGQHPVRAARPTTTTTALPAQRAAAPPPPRLTARPDRPAPRPFPPPGAPRPAPAPPPARPATPPPPGPGRRRR